MGRRIALPLFLTLLAAGTLAANEPPLAPTIQEPEVDGQIINPFDVHMETSAFSDPDPGDSLFCADYEIREVATSEVVWSGPCLTGLEALHAHFGDGTFVGSLSGATELLPETEYELRVRHRDDSGEAGTEWSDWATRLFETGPLTQVFPLEGDDVLDGSAPLWVESATGASIDLPDSADPPRLVLESLDGVLLEIRGLPGPVNQVINPPILPEHGDLRVRLSAGDFIGTVALPATELTFSDHETTSHTVYLPPVSITSAEDVVFWIAASGATYFGSVADTASDLSELAQGIPVPWIVHRPGYKVEIVATGLRLPVNIAFVPNPGSAPGDPKYYVTELYGTIKVVTNDGTVSDYATDLLNFTPSGAFPGSGEQGLTGIVVEPSSGDVIAAMLYDAGGPHYPKVVRYSSLDGGLTASSEVTILDMPGESQGQSHQISNLSIGPDGNLYVHMGDGFDPSTSQNLDSFRGKILRLGTAGSVPTDNPFYDTSNGINARDYVYSYGIRNSFGGVWRTADGVHYQVENGPSTDRFAKALPGVNYQWNGSDFSMTAESILNWSPAVGPTNIAFVEPETFGGSLFPSDVQGHAFIADSGPTWANGPQSRGKRIREYVLDAAGDLVEGPIDFVEYVGTGRATVVGLAAGPDGLYFTDLYRDLDAISPVDVGANVLRVKFIGAADFTADVTEGDAPLTVSFTDQSTVPSPTSWEWSFGDGTTASGPDPVHTFLADGIYTVRLTVTGANGVAVEEKSGFIRVGEFPSIALIGDTLPPPAGDESVAEAVHDLGFEVVHYDDEPANRPSASEIAALHDLVLVSSTGFSANVAGEFRDVLIPLVTWEHALARIDREPFADDSAILPGSTAITVIDDSHPITEGLGFGDYTVFSVPSTLSVIRAPFGPEGQILATAPGTPGDVAIMAVDEGATLLGGYVAPVRRVFLFLENDGLQSATPLARTLLERSILWALDAEPEFTRGDCNQDGAIDVADSVRLLGFLFASGASLDCDDACDHNDDGALDVADAVFALTALFGGGAPVPEPTTCGVDPTLDALGCANSLCP